MIYDHHTQNLINICPQAIYTSIGPATEGHQVSTFVCPAYTWQYGAFTSNSLTAFCNFNSRDTKWKYDWPCMTTMWEFCFHIIQIEYV